jgi:SAM-dependent methyltransferase
MNPYDEIPYPIYSHPQTHPALLATLGRLHGLQPPAVGTCRILELGCAGGGNLIPMAMGLPDAQCTGIDYAASQIGRARHHARLMGISNLRFETQDVCNIDPDLGEFDYIIAHGLYSWVPAPVRDCILQACRRHLAPTGLAFVSYNVHPGWKNLGAIRDYLLYMTRGTDDPSLKIINARKCLQSLLDDMTRLPPSLAGLTASNGEYIKSQIESITGNHAGYVLHDLFERDNNPVYFHEFAASAAGHGLQFIAEVDFKAQQAIVGESTARGDLLPQDDRVMQEQYFDFVSNRSFRQSVLCHRNLDVAPVPQPGALKELYLSSWLTHDNDEDEPGGTGYASPDGGKLTVKAGILTEILDMLIEAWPRAIAYADLSDALRARLDAKFTARDDFDDRLCEDLLMIHMRPHRLIDLRAHPADIPLRISERPVANRWALMQLAEGWEITNLLHQRIKLQDIHRHLLRLLDGSRGREDLLRALLAGPVNTGELTVSRDGEAITDINEIREYLAQGMDKILQQLHRMALLSG